MADTLRERIAAARQKTYDQLKAWDFDLYRQSIQAAEAVTFNHNLPQKVAVDIEAAVVCMAHEAYKRGTF